MSGSCQVVVNIHACTHSQVAEQKRREAEVAAEIAQAEAAAAHGAHKIHTTKLVSAVEIDQTQSQFAVREFSDGQQYLVESSLTLDPTSQRTLCLFDKTCPSDPLANTPSPSPSPPPVTGSLANSASNLAKDQSAEANPPMVIEARREWSAFMRQSHPDTDSDTLDSRIHFVPITIIIESGEDKFEALTSPTLQPHEI